MYMCEVWGICGAVQCGVCVCARCECIGVYVVCCGVCVWCEYMGVYVGCGVVCMCVCVWFGCAMCMWGYTFHRDYILCILDITCIFSELHNIQLPCYEQCY